jgi:hypothetical protein
LPGPYPSSKTFAAHWNGHSWRSYSIPPGREPDDTIGSFAVLSPDHILAAGGPRGGDTLFEWRNGRWLNDGYYYQLEPTVLRRGEFWAV